MPKRVTVVTGPIVGLGSEELLVGATRFAEELGENIVVYDLLDEVLAQERVHPEDAERRADFVGELLDGYDYQFDLMREKAYLAIGRELETLGDEVSGVVRAPASVIWRGVTRELKDHRIIAEALRPERVVTLIDAEWKILSRLRTDYGWHALRVIAHQPQVGVKWVLHWLGSEVSRSEDWAEWLGKVAGKRVPHDVMGVEVPSSDDRSVYVRDVDNLVKLVTAPDLTTFYASYSMTVATDEVRRAIDDLIWRLRSYGAVIDPASIELSESDDDRDAEVKDIVFAYTVTRDLQWDVKKVDIVSAFHPYPEMPPLSTGMMDELGHARAFHKERYLLLPSGAGSPFTRDNYVPAEHVFRDGDALFRHLEQVRRPALPPRFARQCEAFAAWQRRAPRSPARETTHADGG